MYYDRSDRIGRRRVAAFVATFAGVFLLGAAVVAVEFRELRQEPIEAPTAVRANVDELSTCEMEFRDARARTAETHRQADEAELALFQFLNNHFVEAEEQATAESQPHQLPALPTVRPNPEWVQTNQQLTALQQKRDELLTKLTPAHPTVQALDDQIIKTREQLAAIPSQLPAEPNENPLESPADRKSISPPIMPSQTAAKMQRGYRNLLIAAGHARDNYRASLDIETAQWNALQSGEPSPIAMNRAGSVDLRANSLDSQSPAANPLPIPIGALTILTLLSLLAGVVAACRVRPVTLTFTSAEEIEATLGLPVLGRLGPSTREDAA